MSETPRRDALRKMRVKWETDMPLDAIITTLLSEDLLLDFEHAEIEGRRNPMDKSRKAIDYFLTKDEQSIYKLNVIVQKCPGYEHLDLAVSGPVITSKFLEACQTMKEFCRLGYPKYKRFPPIFPSDQEQFAELHLTKRHPVEEEDTDSTSVDNATADTSHDEADEVNASSDLLSTLNRKREREIMIVEGIAGVGKTILAFKAVQDWASDKLDSYTLAILVELSSQTTVQIESLEQLLMFAHGLQGSADSRAVLVEEIKRRRGKGILFVLDGVDRVPEAFTRKSCSYLWKLVSRQIPECMYCSCLITARPAVPLDLRRAATLHLRIQGFSDETVEYILEQWEDHGEQVSKQIRNLPFLRMLCKIPLYLGAAIHCSKIRSTSNVTDLFETFTTSLVLQRSDVQGLRLQDISEDDKSLLVRAGKVAYNGIRKSVFSFYKDDFGSPEVISKLENLSLIIAEGSSGRFRFTHHMFQEFLSALYLVDLSDEALKARLEDDFFTLSDEHLQFAIVFRFFAGLTKLKSKVFEELDSALKPFLKPYQTTGKKDWTQKLYNLITILHGVQESENKALLNLSIQSFYQKHRYFQTRVVYLTIPIGHVFDALDFFTLSYAINNSDVPWALRLSSCNIAHSNMGMLCNSSGPGRGLEELKLEEITISDYGVGALTLLLACYKGSLRSFGLSKLTGAFPNQIFDQLDLQRLQVLELRACNLSSESVDKIALLESTASLSRLVVADNPDISESASKLCETLSRCTSLAYLDISGCQLGPTGTAALSSYVRNNSNLDQLLFDDDTPANSDIQELLDTVQSSRLTKVWLNNKYEKPFGQQKRIGQCSVVFGLGLTSSVEDVDVGQPRSYFTAIRNLFGW